jgi:hypothetical protein
MRFSMVVLGVALLLAPASGEARGGGRSGSGFRELERQLRYSYQRTHPCPSTGKTYGWCPGYVVGYIVLPKHGGTYQQLNMRWMTKQEAEQSGQNLW